MSISDAVLPRLQQYLSSELYARLSHDGTLPPALLVQACTRLRRELGIIASFVPHPLVQRHLTRTHREPVYGAFWHGSMLVAEVIGLTRLIDHLAVSGQEGAETATQCIQQLFDGFLDEIQHYSGGLFGGGVLEFRGNTLSAFFDATILEQHHATHAANAALALQTRFVTSAIVTTHTGDFRLELRIGIHSGHFFVAELGDAQHIALMVTGPQMQRAVRARALAAPGEIVITDDVLALLDQVGSEARHPGFHVLRYLPKLPPPPTPSNWGWESGTSTMADLLQLVMRIETLRPYLPHGLPLDRLVEGTERSGSGAFRAVTVLGCHITPFDLILDRFVDDPMMVALLLNTYYRRVQATVRRYGGRVNRVGLQSPGDVLNMFFGDPEGLEDAPLRAVRAALDMRDDTRAANEEIADLLGTKMQAAGDVNSPGRHWSSDDLQPPWLLIQRIGISTGTLFTGQVGRSLRREQVAIGMPINTALQLATAADHNAIWLAPATCRMVRRYVRVAEKAPLEVHNSSVMLVPTSVEALDDMEIHAQVAPLLRAKMVGRDAELRFMLEQAALTAQGQGRFVALVGEAGIGKTRLIEETLRQLLSGATRQQPFRACMVKCQSYDQNTPYTVVRGLLRQMLALAANIDPSEARHMAYAFLDQAAPHLLPFLPILGVLLNLPIAETACTTSLSSDQRHERAYDLLQAILHAVAREQPLVLVIDDLHWADASSVGLLEKLALAIHTLPILLIGSYRPDGLEREPWRDADPTSILDLHEILPIQRMQLVASLIGALPPPDLLALLQQAQGNPFFIEELIYNLIEQGILQRDVGGWGLRASPEMVSLPYNIEHVMRARLDRLSDSERELLQVAAVIGRTVSLDLLASLLVAHVDLADRLTSLEQSGFIRAEGAGYVFRHTLLRDIIYSTTPFARRRTLHRRIAARLAESDQGQLELLARHTLLAEEWAAAFLHHVAAGRQAQARHANHEALALYETALAIAPRLEPQPTDELVLLHEHLGLSYTLFGQHKAALTSFDQALNLCKQADSTATIEDQVRLRRRIAEVYERYADYATAFKWLESALASTSNQPGLELTRCLLLGAGIHERQGKYAAALEWATQALDAAVALESAPDQAHAYYLLAGIYGNRGNHIQAVDLARQSLQRYQQIHDLQGEARARINLANFLHELGDWAEARTQYEAAAGLMSLIGGIHEQAMIANNLGDLLRGMGEFAAALEQYQVARRGWQHSLYGNGVVAMNMASVYLRQGDLPLATRQFNLSMDLFSQAGAEGFLPELLRYRAELALLQEDIDAALLAAYSSLDYALHLGARLEEGATRRIMGRILAAQGDLGGAEAELLASIAALREVGSRYEEACTLLEVANLLPLRQDFAQGRVALEQALAIFAALGARYDLERTYQVAERWQYRIVGSS